MDRSSHTYLHIAHKQRSSAQRVFCWNHYKDLPVSLKSDERCSFLEQEKRGIKIKMIIFQHCNHKFDTFSMITILNYT